MDYQAQVMKIIAVPLLGSLLIPILGWMGRKKLTGYLAVLLIATANILTWSLLGPGLDGLKTFTIYPLFHGLGVSINFGLNVDALSIFMSFTATLIATLIAIYSLGYIEHEEHEPEYYFIVTLFVGAMMGLVFSTSLIFLYLFWEISALACWRLIGYYRDPEYVWKADKAFLITFAGAVFMLLGFGLVFAQYGSFDLVGPGSLAGKPIGAVALALIMAGIFSKSATVPLHTWIPDAGVAPSTITSLLHAAILVKIGLYGFARMFLNGMVIPTQYWVWILGFAMASAFIAGCGALVETNIKRVLAYSTISQIGYMFLGFAAVSRWGYIGAILYIMAHGFAKGGLFLCAGIIEHGTHTKDMTKMGGLLKKMPITAIVYLTCALSIAGIPPLAGFFAKDFVITGLFEGGHPAVAIMAILTAVLTLMYMLRSFHMVFLGAPRGESHHEGSPIMVGVVAVIAALTLLSGLGLQLPWNLADKADQQRQVLAAQAAQAVQISTQP
jgi:NADH:ubiquinone oxidoreductase subunit 5 (subunit L)/multisubunit Na+/H+ antiporter MnhA subunit